MFFLWIVPFTHLVSGDWVEISQSPKIHRDLKLITNAQVTPTPINDAYSDIAEEIEDTQNSTLRLLPFVEMIQDTLLTNENKSTRKKTLFLQNLRDNLLINIEKRMRHLWLTPHKAGEAREYKEEHYHMDFPSNEGALMTIGFLTFAVFLIKLVLKLINALKSKYNSYYNNPDPDTTTTYFGRKKRSVEEATRILQLIEEYSGIY